MPVLAGIGALRTDAAVRLAQDARAAGAAAGLLAAVSYTPLTADEVFEHVATVARESGLPLCLYDNPATTHFSFTPGLIARLSRVEGVVAAKVPAPPADAAAGQIAALRHAVRPGFAIGCSGDWLATEALLAGAKTWYSVAAGVFPAACVRIAEAARSGDAAEARRLDAQMEPLWALFREYSSLRVAYVCADALGLCRAEPPRPILPLAGPVRERILRTVAALGSG